MESEVEAVLLLSLTEDMKNLVRKQKLGFVATVCPDGTPNLSPKGTTTIWDDYHLVFADIASPDTVKNLRNNPSIEVNVVDPFVRKGYRFKGRGVVYQKGDQPNAFDQMLSFYKRDGLQDAERRVKSIVLIEIESAEALISPGYDYPVSEGETIEKWKKYYDSLEHSTQIKVEQY